MLKYNIMDNIKIREIDYEGFRQMEQALDLVDWRALTLLVLSFLFLISEI
jgi:hypothetical protein